MIEVAVQVPPRPVLPLLARLSSADQCCERQLAEFAAFADRGGFTVLDIFKEATWVLI